jgi:glycosyltransferase involved in cell wall biosynthesis
LNRRNTYYQKIKRINNGDIIVKKKVDPADELSRAWVYLYPIRQVQETFSVPLSFIEAMQVGTPFIGTNVGGIPEYFNKECLIPPGDVQALVKKIKSILREKKTGTLKKRIDNAQTIQQFIRLYGME